MKKINVINLPRMNNGAHFDFMEKIVQRIKDDATVAARTATLTAALEAALAEEDECLVLSRKSFKSDDIAEADRRRDELYTKYRRAVKAFTGMPVEAMAQASKVLEQHIRDYNINVKAQFDKESGLLTNLIADLEGKHAPHVEALMLTRVVADMKQANERVKALLTERENESVGRQVGALKKARARTDEAYHALVDMVNAMALVLGEADYAAFIDGVNMLVTRYKREVLDQKASTPETTPGTGSGEGDTPGTGGDTPGTGGGDTGGENPGGSGDGDGGTSFD